MSVCGVVIDVFQHHDGVIHDHTDAHGDTAQTHHVHGQITHVHQNEGGQRTHGHGDGDGQGGAPAAQEQKHHNARQQHAQQAGGKADDDGLLWNGEKVMMNSNFVIVSELPQEVDENTFYFILKDE